RCLRCNRDIAPRPSTVIGRGADPCVYCAKRLTDPAEAVELMREAGFEPLEPYAGSRRPWRSRCVRCGREVRPWYSSVSWGGCGYCAGNRLDPLEAVERMRGAGIEPDGPYPGRRAAPWPGRCIRCGTAVRTSLSTALDARGAGGCPSCANKARGDAQRVPPD